MADDTGVPTPEGQQPQPENVMALIRQMIDSRMEQRMGQVTAQISALVNDAERRLSVALTNAVDGLRDSFRPPVAPPSPAGAGFASQPAGAEVELPPMPPLPLGGLLGDALRDPNKLAELVGGMAQAFRQVKDAFRPDDFALAREIFARTPAAIIMTTPDPMQGHLPQLLSNMIQQGVRIGATAKTPLTVGGDSGITPLAPAAPGVLPGGPPPPSVTPSATPGPSIGTILQQACESLSPQDQEVLLHQLVRTMDRSMDRKAA